MARIPHPLSQVYHDSRYAGAFISEGALIGIEVKQGQALTTQACRQGEMEMLLWNWATYVGKFHQIVTDFERGGVLYRAGGPSCITLVPCRSLQASGNAHEAAQMFESYPALTFTARSKDGSYIAVIHKARQISGAGKCARSHVSFI